MIQIVTGGSQHHPLTKTSSKQSNCCNLHLKWPHGKTNKQTFYYSLPPWWAITSFTIYIFANMKGSTLHKIVKCQMHYPFDNAEFPWSIQNTCNVWTCYKYRTKLTIVFTVAWQLKHQPDEKCGGQLNSLHGIFSLLHTFDKTIKLFPNILMFEFCRPLRIL